MILLQGGIFALRFHSSGLQHLKVGAGLRREIYLIFKEAINNAARHSHCSRIDVEFSANEGTLDLTLTPGLCTKLPPFTACEAVMPSSPLIPTRS